MKKIVWLVVSLTTIAAICAAVLAYVDSITKGPIAVMKEKQKNAAALAVMPKGVVKVSLEGEVFVGKDATGKPIGYATLGKDPNGYGGDIVLMVGFESDRKTVVSYKVLTANETPGLGMKLKSPEFANQFCGKDGGTIKLKKKGGEVEAITSATITSRAVCKAVNDAAKRVK